MRELGLLLLRISMGGLMVFWGIDKLANVEHSVRVAEAFYMGIGTNTTFLAAAGVAQIVLGALIVIGLMRRLAYPALFLICLEPSRCSNDSIGRDRLPSSASSRV